MNHARAAAAALFLLAASSPACRAQRRFKDRHRARAAASAPARPTERLPPRVWAHALPPVDGVRAFRAEKPEDLVAGPNAAGRIGDYVLENAQLRAVVDDISGGGGFALSGGQLVDLVRRDVGEDELGQVFNFLGTFPRQLKYTSVELVDLGNGARGVVASGEDPSVPGLTGRTMYSLAPGDRALVLTTSLHNGSDHPVEIGYGDAIQWAGAEHWAPDVGFALRGERTVPYLAGVGAFSTYAYVAEGGRPVFGPSGGHWSNPMLARTTLAAGGRLTYRRAVGVAGPSDVAGAVASTGWMPENPRLVVHVVTARGRAPVEGATVILRAPGSDGPVLMAGTDAAGDARMEVPAGAYVVDVASPGRVAVPPRGSVTGSLPVQVSADGAQVTAQLSEASVLDVYVDGTTDLAGTSGSYRAPWPARVIVEGIGGTRDPRFGAIGRADGARNTFLTDLTGRARRPLAPGQYRVTVTHGPAFTLGVSTVTIGPGDSVPVRVRLEPALDLGEYTCGDFHVHQAPSLDSSVALDDRVMAAAAEGLTLLASTDHNVVTDLGEAVRRQGLQGRLLALTGDEVSTDVARRPMGHWNLFPLTADPTRGRGGAPDLFELTPDEIVRAARALSAADAPIVVQLNHPRAGEKTGLFDTIHFDPATRRSDLGVFRPTFDAIEVWNGRYQDNADRVLDDWLALLRTGARIVGTANSDSHGVAVQEVGWPRTCLRAGNPPGLASVLAALHQTHDVIMTDGPMITVDTTQRNPVSAIGRRVCKGPDGTVRLDVTVRTPSWLAVDTLEMIHADGRRERIETSFVRDGNLFRANTTVTLRPGPTEPFVLFRVRGASRVPTVVEDPPLFPMAITNPVYLGTCTAR